MQSVVLNVEGMSCEHCVRAINNAVGDLDGVANVAVSLKDKTVAVSYDASKASLEDIKSAIEEEGYTVK